MEPQPLRRLDEVAGELGRWATSDVPRVPTGYSFFDSRTNGGIASGEFCMMLARTGVGKTFFALNVAAYNQAVPTLFLSFEMHARYILSRLAAIHQDISTDDIENTYKARGKCLAVDRTVEAFPLLVVDDEQGQTPGGMLDKCDEYEAMMGVRPRLVLLDYVELVRAFGNSQQENVDRLTWSLKAFAREADVALIALHQVNRGEVRMEGPRGDKQPVKNEGQWPVTMTDARFGGEMAGDYMMGMYRPYKHPLLAEQDRKRLENDVRFQFLKTRTAGDVHPSGVQHHWDLRTGRISELRWSQGVFENHTAATWRPDESEGRIWVK